MFILNELKKIFNPFQVFDVSKSDPFVGIIIVIVIIVVMIDIYIFSSILFIVIVVIST